MSQRTLDHRRDRALVLAREKCDAGGQFAKKQRRGAPTRLAGWRTFAVFGLSKYRPMVRERVT